MAKLCQDPNVLFSQAAMQEGKGWDDVESQNASWRKHEAVDSVLAACQHPEIQHRTSHRQ
jgi:hypothetical protein